MNFTDIIQFENFSPALKTSTHCFKEIYKIFSDNFKKVINNNFFSIAKPQNYSQLCSRQNSLTHNLPF